MRIKVTVEMEFEINPIDYQDNEDGSKPTLRQMFDQDIDNLGWGEMAGEYVEFIQITNVEEMP